jgi:hypothetical protein
MLDIYDILALLVAGAWAYGHGEDAYRDRPGGAGDSR